MEIALQGGSYVRVDFDVSQFQSLVTFQLLDAAHQSIAEPYRAFSSVTYSPYGPASTLDNFSAIPLSGGGFVVACDIRWSDMIETFNAGIYDGNGHWLASVVTTIGTDLAENAPVPAAPVLFDLSHDRFAALTPVVNGDGSSAAQLSIHSAVYGSAALSLPTAPDIIEHAGGDLVLHWTNGESLSTAAVAVNGVLTGGPGADTLHAADVADSFMQGGDGNDLIIGGHLFDRMNGNAGNDTVRGYDGDDWITGGKDDDLLSGGWGNNILNGNLGNDTANGGEGNDTVRGGQGDDVLSGDYGNDYLTGDLGDDTLTGGYGADTFRVFAGGGHDVITDFNAADGDRIVLDPGTTYTATQSGADVVLDLSWGGQTVLKNVTLSALPDGWIVGG